MTMRLLVVVMVLEQKVVEIYANGFIRPSKSPAGAPRQAGKDVILPKDFLLVDASMGFHLQQCKYTVCREGAHLGEFTWLQLSYLLICLSKSPSRPPALRDYASARTVAFDYVSIPTTCPPREVLAWTKVSTRRSGICPTSIDVPFQGGKSPHHSPRCSGWAHQQTHQPVRPRLWVSIMGLMMMVGAVVISTGSPLPRVCYVQPCCADIQVFI